MAVFCADGGAEDGVMVADATADAVFDSASAVGMVKGNLPMEEVVMCGDVSFRQQLRWSPFWRQQ